MNDLESRLCCTLKALTGLNVETDEHRVRYSVPGADGEIHSRTVEGNGRELVVSLRDACESARKDMGR